MAWKQNVNGDRRDESNAGFSAYIGSRRIAWSLSLDETIAKAREVVKDQRTHKRFVPSVTLFDCSLILVVGFITDDSNGITVHGRSASRDYSDPDPVRVG